MSCHTWAYRKINAEEEKEFREYVKENLMNDYRYIPDNVTEEDYINDLWERLTKGGDMEWTRFELDESVTEGNFKIRVNLQKIPTCNMKEMEEIYKTLIMATKYKFYNGECYVECGFDEPVRIYGYPGDKFTDPKKFVKWIKKQEAKKGSPISTLYRGEKENIIGFCEEMEKAIYDFWNKYDGNVLVEFG